MPANFWKLGVSLFEIHGKLLVIFHIIANTSLFLKTLVIIAMDTAKNKGIDAKKRKHGGKVLPIPQSFYIISYPRNRREPH